MRVLFDLGHPAHVHYFKNLIKLLKKNGNQVLIVAREKDVTHSLLRNYKIPYSSRGKGSKTLSGKLFYLFKANFQLYKYSIVFKPDLFISFASPYAAQIANYFNKPHIAFTDTEHAKLGIASFLPFTDTIITPKTFKGNLGHNHIKFDGYMEDTYLHPKYFKPNKNILKKLNLNNQEKYVVLRLVSWDASHDIGQKGFRIDALVKLIAEIKNHARIFISAENKIPRIFKKYQLSINPTEIHDVLSFAELFIGEGATMASECAIMGTPSIYINSLSAGTLEDQEKKGILSIFKSSNGLVEKSREILMNPKAKKETKQKSIDLFKNKIDINIFFYWLISNYPKSIIDYKNN
tara:strand:+ start:337 stop:1383 length:1047 start_codon:yes stop_codon:yes gene_type:complete